MAGGDLHLQESASDGAEYRILTGNPTKTFFKTKYSKYTNFGLQKFRIDQEGQKNLTYQYESNIQFKMPRYADLLMDTYLIIKLPNIWSPIYCYDNSNNIPCEFQWIKNIGSQIIKEVTFTIGGTTIQKFSGTYLQNMVERDFDSKKKELYDIMIGNVKELYDPANYSDRVNDYPHAYKINDSSNNSIEPSIRSYNLYIPIHSWFTLLPSMALPLISLPNSQLMINFRLRPFSELYTIKRVDINDNNKIIRGKGLTNFPSQQIHRFIQQPPMSTINVKSDGNIDILIDDNGYYRNNNVYTDIHLVATQCFLENEEKSLFLENKQEYLIKKVYEYEFTNISKSCKLNLESNGLVSNWMWFVQRDDVGKRNEWSNYTNWPFENIIPYTLIPHTISGENFKITGDVPTQYQQTFQKELIKDFAIIADGTYRENSFPGEVYSRLEKYARTNGNSKEGLYHYNFSLATDNTKYQPSGAFNTNRFKNIEFEVNLYENPPFEKSVLMNDVCAPSSGDIIAETPNQSIYKYNYNLFVMEERYNILQIQYGSAYLLYN